MVIPRSWGNIEEQRDPQQTSQFAEPTATDIRFKLAAFFLFGGWLTTVFSLHHSIRHYKPRNRGILNRSVGIIKYTPPKFLLTLPLSLVMVGYAAACSFEFSISPLNLNANLGMMYGLGWGSISLIIIVNEIYGYIDPNEDRELIRQRRIRGAEIDREIGITKKPNWWRRLHGDNRELNIHDHIARNVGEIGGGRATTKNLERSIEMGNMPVSKRRDSNKSIGELEAIRLAANLLFPNASSVEGSERMDPFTDQPDRGRSPGDARPREMRNETRAGLSDRSDSTASGVTLSAQPQVVRSMLDI
jgi:hypothetical protein